MKKLAVEFLGTALLSLVAMLSSSDAFAIAGVLAFMVLAWGGISGGHFNSSVTIAMWVRKEISGIDTIKYSISQILGVVVAFLIINLMRENNTNILLVGNISFHFDWAQTTSEFIAGFVVMIAMLASIRAKISHAWGFALAHLVLLGGFGTMINTSFTLGSFFNGYPLGAMVVLALGQIAGAIVAVKFDQIINKK